MHQVKFLFTYSQLFFLLLLVQLHPATVSAQAKSESFAPHFYTLQYAGSIGFLSAGAGYELGKKTRLSAHYGYVPESVGGAFHIVSAKLMYSPWQIEVNPEVKINLLDFGLFFSYHFGNQFASSWPAHRYPDGYYWWKTSMRYHFAIENSIRFYRGPESKTSFSLFTEFNTNDLYLVSYALNTRSMRLIDIFKAGVGIRMYMR